MYQIKDRIGFGSVTVTHKETFDKKRKMRKSPLYIINITAKQGRNILKHVIPYMQIKRKQAELFIQFPLRPKGNKQKNKKRMEEDAIIYQEQIRIVNEIKKLNRTAGKRA